MDVDSPVRTSFTAQFNTLSTLPAQKRASQLPQLLDTIVTTASSDTQESDLIAYLIYILDHDRPISSVNKPTDQLNLLTTRPLLSEFAEKLRALPSNDIRLSVAQTATTLISPRVVSFEEQDTALKFVLSDAQQADDEFAASARTLDSINLTASSRAVSDEEKVKVWVQIARCYLEVDDPVSASTYINRAKQVLHNVKDPTLRLHFYSSSARILDSQKQFLDAANAYHTISYEPLVDEEDRLRTLSVAITCAILAGAGPQRSRTLAKLYKDDRAAECKNFGILEKIFLDRILEAEEISSFAAELPDHQKAKTSDGSTVVEKAMLEHNLLGVSHIYRNIGIEQLGSLLGTDAERAEAYAAQMIQQGRLAGYIDQIDQVIFFTGTPRGGETGSIETGGQELRQWDANVQGLTEEVEKVTTMIQNEFPEFYTANMVY